MHIVWKLILFMSARLSPLPVLHIWSVIAV